MVGWFELPSTSRLAAFDAAKLLKVESKTKELILFFAETE
jgi:hypothetical protein